VISPRVEIIIVVETPAFARVFAESAEDEERVALELAARRESLLREIDEALDVLLARREERA
jgi:hypothetical protein